MALPYQLWVALSYLSQIRMSYYSACSAEMPEDSEMLYFHKNLCSKIIYWFISISGIPNRTYTNMHALNAPVHLAVTVFFFRKCEKLRKKISGYFRISLRIVRTMLIKFLKKVFHVRLQIHLIYPSTLRFYSF